MVLHSYASISSNAVHVPLHHLHPKLVKMSFEFALALVKEGNQIQ